MGGRITGLATQPTSNVVEELASEGVSMGKLELFVSIEKQWHV